MSCDREKILSVQDESGLDSERFTEEIAEAVRTIEMYLVQTKEVLDRIEDYIRELKGEEHTHDKIVEENHKKEEKELDWFAKPL